MAKLAAVEKPEESIASAVEDQAHKVEGFARALDLMAIGLHQETGDSPTTSALVHVAAALTEAAGELDRLVEQLLKERASSA